MFVRSNQIRVIVYAIDSNNKYCVVDRIKSEVLFFDEVTSALDPETEVEVNKTIESLSINDGITIVMIAHKESGLDFVNKIIRI